MAITINIEPSMPDPIPVNRPIFWELEADNADVFTSTGTKPVIQIVWPASPTAPADGSELTLWGYLFTVDSGTAFTGNSFRVVAGDMATTRNNFRSMLQANFFFSKAVTFQVTGTGGNTLNVLWRDCREQENFGVAGMEYDTLETGVGATVTVTNGASPITVDGHKIVTSLVRYDPSTNTYTEITPQEGVDTVADCLFSYAVGIDFQRQISDLLYTNIPALTTDSFDIPGYDTMFQYFALKYGWIYREDCRALSGDFQYTDLVRVWNGVILDTDITGIRKYYPGAVGGLPSGQTHIKFLTDAPADGVHLRLDSFAWLYFFVNKDAVPFDTLQGSIIATIDTGFSYSYNFSITDFTEVDGVICLNVSPMIAVDETAATEANIQYIRVRIFKTLSSVQTALTEYAYIYIDRECGSNADMYFRNRLGGIDTLPVIVTEEVAAQSGEEIRLSLKPVTTTVERMTLRGRTLSNVVNQKRFTIQAKQDWSEDYVYFFESFRTSTMRYLQVFAKDGTPYAQKVVIDPGNVTIRKEGEKIILEASGYYAHDIFAQSTTEPQMF